MRVYIADDDPEVRQALRLLLEQQLGYEVVGEAAHSYGLTSLVESAGADLVILDWELPGRVDTFLLASLRRLSPKPRIIAISCRPDLKASALAAGADGFAGKGDAPDDLVALLAGRAAK